MISALSSLEKSERWELRGSVVVAVPASTREGIVVLIAGCVVMVTVSVNDPGNEEKKAKVKVFC